MDVDTDWVNHHDFRHLRALREDWPAFACIYFALLGDCWKAEDRLPLDARTWHNGLFQTDLPTARRVLKEAGLLDKGYRIPESSWEEWFEPVAKRLRHLRGLNASRWAPPVVHLDTHAGVQSGEGNGREGKSTSTKPRQPDSARGGAPRGLKDLMKAAGYVQPEEGT